jgi:tetratricopeptide (TPR) repeat protein
MQSCEKHGTLAEIAYPISLSTTSMTQKWWLARVVAVVVLGLLLRGPALLSSALGNVGLVTLSKAVTPNPEAPVAEVLVEAEVWLKLALASNAANRGAHRGLGCILVLWGQDEQAAAEWHAAGLTAQDFVVRGEQARLAGGYEEARWWYEQAVSAEAGLENAWRAAGLTAQDLIGRGERAYHAQQYAEAQWWYEQAQLLAPDLQDEWRTAGLTAQDCVARGEQAYRAEQHAEAQWWYETAALLAPDLAGVWRAAGLTAQDLIGRGERAQGAQRYEDALWWYGLAELLDPGLRSSVLLLEHVALRDSGEQDSAVEKLQEAVSLDHGWLNGEARFRAWYLWGAWLYQEGRDTEAQQALTKAIAVHPQGEQLRWEYSEAYRLLGLVQQAEGRLEQAVQSLEMAVQVNEGNAWAHSHFGQVLYRYDAQRVAEVDKQFSAALSLRPDDVELWRNLISFWVGEGEAQRAEALYVQAEQRGMLRADDVFAWGDRARGAGRHEEALKWYGRVAVLAPELQGTALYLEYVTLRESGDQDSAPEKLQEAISLDQGWLDGQMRLQAWYQWGAYLYGEGRHAEAEDALMTAVAADMEAEQLQWERSEAYRLLGLVQQGQGRLEQAVQSLEMAVQVNEGNAWAHSHLGQVLYRYDAQRVAEVDRQFSAALSLRPDDVELWRNLISFWVGEGEAQRAEALYVQAQRRAMLPAKDLRAWGAQAYRAANYREALWWYEQAEVLQAGLQSTVLYLQYLTLRGSGDMDSWVEKLQEAVSLDRGWLDPGMRFRAWYLWGAWLHQQGQGLEAEKALANAVAIYPEGSQLEPMLSEAYHLLGLMQQAQGELEQAVRSLESAVRLDQRNVWAHSHLGQALYWYDAQRAPQVDKEFSAALSLRPDDVQLWRNLILFWLRAGEKERAIALCLQARQKGIVSGLEEVCPAS